MGSNSATWDLPGKISEPASDQLKAFGIDSLPGARINAVDPPAHPGFQAVQRQIASNYGGDMARAGRILGSRTRKASAAAKRANPRLLRVKG